MGKEDVSFLDLFVELNKRKTIREIRALMRRLEDATKEDNENKPNEDKATDGNPDTTDHRATDYA